MLATHLTSKFSKNIPFLRRFIDDTIDIFVLLVNNDGGLKTWELFQKELPF